MKRSTFLLISAILSFAFGAMMFFIPAFAATLLGMSFTPETAALLHGMGGLIIGSGAINFFLRNQNNTDAIKGLLLTNIITHLLGISADVWSVIDGAVTASKIAPVEITHLFIGIGSLHYLLKLKAISKN
ncbi:MAG: hypothetical protein ACR2FN_15295 [Chitinophagaceae bacterium]